ncbi:MAG: T9SS type A sorting domain-containing protein [Bacteroidota bacterium]
MRIKFIFLLSILAVKGFSQCSLTPVVDLRFNGNANDFSPYANNGTMTGATFSGDRFGNPGSAAQFDGSNDYVDIGSNTSLNFADQFTLSAWIYFTTPANDMKIIEQCDNVAQWANYQVIVTSTSQIGVGLRENLGTTKYTYSSQTLSSNQWYHLVVTWNKSINGGACRIFINGIETTYSMQEPLITDLYVLTPESTKIGADVYTPLDAYSGKMDDLKLFQCSLSAFQADSIYEAEAPMAPCGLTINPIIADPTCHDGNDGGISVTVSGGSGSYSYLWSNSQTTSGIAGLFPGDYTLTINDGVDCDTMITYTVNNPAEITFNVSIVSPNCGGNDGSAMANFVNGGQSPYSYSWSSGDTLDTADSLTAGIYMVTVTDANGCSASQTFGLNNTTSLNLSATTTNASCAGVFDGDIDLTVAGGTGPYTYSWSNAAVTEDLSNVKSGAYMVQVTDANGCVAVLTVNLIHNVIDLSAANIVDPTCGNTNGSVTVFPSGGVTPYTYQWSPNAGGSTTNSITGFGSGAYYLTVTDSNGCSETQGFMLSNPGGPVVQLNSITYADCEGNNGSVNISIASGIPPFSYSWSNGSTAQDLTNVTEGFYDLDVMDGNGCVTMFGADVPGLLPPPITLCMTTVDSTTGKVLCVWEKPALDHMSHFNIYRENAIAGQYDFWFSKPWDSLSQWTDQTANPLIRGWRYKVTMVDTCGNESPFGTNHKTIHLTASLGVGGVVNLIWDDYEGFPVSTFYIDRYHPSTGWVLIDSLPSSLHSYTDPSPPGLGNLKYSIDVKPPSGICTSTRAVNHNYTRSNRGGFEQPSVILPLENILDVNLYPNPSNGDLTIELLNGEAAQVEITDLTGRIIFSSPQNSLRKEYSLSAFSSGVYIVKVYSGQRQFKTRWIKQ